MRSSTVFARSSARFSCLSSWSYFSSSAPPSTATTALKRSSVVLTSSRTSSCDRRASRTRFTRMSRFSIPNFFIVP